MEILKQLMNAKYLATTYWLTMNNEVIETHTVINYYATSIIFRNHSFASHYNIPLTAQQAKQSIQVINI